MHSKNFLTCRVWFRHHCPSQVMDVCIFQLSIFPYFIRITARQAFLKRLLHDCFQEFFPAPDTQSATFNVIPFSISLEDVKGMLPTTARIHSPFSKHPYMGIANWYLHAGSDNKHREFCLAVITKQSQFQRC